MGNIFFFIMMSALCFMMLFIIFSVVDLTMDHRLSDKLNKMFDKKFGD